MKAMRSLALLAVLYTGEALYMGAALAQTPAAENTPVPPELPVEAFSQLASFKQLTMSPNGKHISWMQPIDGRDHVVIRLNGMEGSKARPIVIPPIDEAEVAWHRWANNDRVLVSYRFFHRDYGTTTVQTRLLSFSAEGDEYKQLLAPKRSGDWEERFSSQHQDQIISMLPDDPEHILMTKRHATDNYANAVKVDIYRGTDRRERRARGGVQDYMADQTGELRLEWGLAGRNFDTRVMRYHNPESGDWEDVTQTDWYKQGLRPAHFSPDPRYAYAIGPNGGDRDKVVLLDMVEGDVERVVYEDPEVDVGGVLVEALTGRAIGVAYYRHRLVTHYFDEEYDLIQRSVDAAMPDTDNEILSLTPDRKKVLMKISTPSNPGDIYFLNRETGQMDFITSVMKNLDPRLLAPVELVEYEARDGLPISGYLTVPKGRDPSGLPTVLLPHGGPYARDYMTYDYIPQFLANRGYAVFQPQFRGSAGFGFVFEALGRKQWGGAMQDDLTDAARWLVDEGIADPDRMCIAGASYGGYAALMGAVKTPDLFACAISINGVSNLPRMIKDDKDYIGGNLWTRRIGLDGDESKSVSPYHRVDEITAPVQIIHAENDSRVPFKHAAMMEDELDEAGKQVEFIKLEDGNHWLETQKARQETLKAMEAFLAKHIGEKRQTIAGGTTDTGGEE